MNRNYTAILWLALLATMTIVSSIAHTQTLPIRHFQAPHKVTSGMHTGFPDKATSVFRQLIAVDSADWIRVHFSAYNLGAESQIVITSELDGNQQTLNVASLRYWDSTSAVFNGGNVIVELLAGPNDTDVYFTVDEVTVAEWTGVGPDELSSLCGADNRVASSDARVGRLFFGGCTAWMITNGAFLTAGHCTDLDPDGTGSQLPDGVLDLTGVVEFNVPASLSNGSPVAADPADQYPIDLTSPVWNYDGAGQGLGKDWAIFACNPNDTSGRSRHSTHGPGFRMSRSNPANGNTIRITGYGVDSLPNGTTGNRNAQNMTEQTSTGPYVTENSSGGNFWHEYQTDTEGANSGSPIIRSSGVTIGIHTNGGCGGSNGNSGTSFEHNALQTAMHRFPGSFVEYVDKGHPELPYTETGDIFRPYNTIAEGVNAVTAGGILIIVKGSYNETMTISKAMMMRAPAGTVTIGQ